MGWGGVVRRPQNPGVWGAGFKKERLPSPPHKAGPSRLPSKPDLTPYSNGTTAPRLDLGSDYFRRIYFHINYFLPYPARQRSPRSQSPDGITEDESRAAVANRTGPTQRPGVPGEECTVDNTDDQVRRIGDLTQVLGEVDWRLRDPG